MSFQSNFIPTSFILNSKLKQIPTFATLIALDETEENIPIVKRESETRMAKIVHV